MPLHMIGEESLDIFNMFTFSQDEIDKIQPLFKSLISILPQRNILYTYYRYFHTCTQNGCSFDNFLIDIKSKAKTCEFGSLEDNLIHDRIVCVIDSKETRERLLRDSESVLNKAANTVRAIKISRIQVSDLEGKTAADSTQKSQVQSNSDQ